MKLRFNMTKQDYECLQRLREFIKKEKTVLHDQYGRYFEIVLFDRINDHINHEINKYTGEFID